MLDLRYVVENPDAVKAGLHRKGYEKPEAVDQLITLDQERRDLIQAVETMKAERNAKSKEIGEAKRKGEDTAGIQEAVRTMGETITSHDQKLNVIDEDITALLLDIPNLPDADVPDGKDENDNAEVKVWGEKPTFDFEPKAHWDIGKDLDILDFERATKISGSGFIVYKGLGARMEHAFIQFMLNMHTQNHGYTEVLTPFVALDDSMRGTGQIPKEESNMYKLERDPLYLIPTAEVPITNLHRDEILPTDKLPIKYVGYSPCFRREAGAAGKDNRGALRVHQFNKVEMVNFAHPDDSPRCHEEMLTCATNILEALHLHYRVVLLCTGDMSANAAKCYDVEVWSPGVKRYLEISSVSNFRDYQSRRAKIKFKAAGSKDKPQLAHTLNGSGLATARLISAVLETYQQADGSVLVPEALQDFLGTDKITAP